MGRVRIHFRATYQPGVYISEKGDKMLVKLNTQKLPTTTTIGIFIAMLTVRCQTVDDHHVLLENQKWIHGSEDCSTNAHSLIQVVRYNVDTWILRQNKCVHYEAPFMFLFIGDNKALLVDTGATGDENNFPLYRIVNTILTDWQTLHKNTVQLIVAHTHGHRDHIEGDAQFRGKADIEVVGVDVESIKKYFSIQHWPEDNSSIELGGRLVEILPIPGHQRASISFYDHSSRLFLTGDTFYPGRLYVEDWAAFKQSIDKLLEFAEHHEISYILGNHIEMSSSPGIDYPTGSTFQPEEHRLPLTIYDLQSLKLALDQLGNSPTRAVHDSFIISPK